MGYVNMNSRAEQYCPQWQNSREKPHVLAFWPTLWSRGSNTACQLRGANATRLTASKWFVASLHDLHVPPLQSLQIVAHRCRSLQTVANHCSIAIFACNDCNDATIGIPGEPEIGLSTLPLCQLRDTVGKVLFEFNPIADNDLELSSEYFATGTHTRK